MADFKAPQPVQTKDDAHKKMQSKLVDFTTPTQGATIDADGNLHVELHGNDPAGVDRVVKTSEQGHVSLNGDYDAATNTVPSSSAIVAHDRNAAPGITHQNKRVTAVVGENDTVRIDTSIAHSDGTDITEANPLPVYAVPSPGTEVHDPFTSANLGVGISVTHTYLVAGTDFELEQILASSAQRLKVEILSGPVGTEVSRFVGFTSVISPNFDFKLSRSLKVVVGDNVLVTFTNIGEDASDVYSTIIGVKAV